MTRDELRMKAVELALAAHAPEPISAALLIQEAERIANYIETGDAFLPRDKNQLLATVD